jgi:hypothetical protein
MVIAEVLLPTSDIEQCLSARAAANDWSSDGNGEYENTKWKLL